MSSSRSIIYTLHVDPSKECNANSSETQTNDIIPNTSDDKNAEVDDVISSDVQCGIGACRSKRFGSILQYTLVYGFAVFVTQALAHYIGSQITTLEKQFSLSSTESGIILSCNDIGFLCTVLFVSHFGPKCHIPRFLSVCIMIYGISGLLSSLPQFISGIGMPVVDGVVSGTQNLTVANGLCRARTDLNNSYHSDACADTKDSPHRSVKWVVAFLGVTMVMQGVGKSPRSSLSTLYIDNNTEKTKTGFYLGIVTTMGFLGPVLGIVLGGLFGKIPVDLQQTNLTPKDPRWIGAWWIGFLVFGSLGVFSSIPVFLFPRRLKSAPVCEKPKVQKDKLKEKKTLLEVFKAILGRTCTSWWKKGGPGEKSLICSKEQQLFLCRKL